MFRRPQSIPEIEQLEREDLALAAQINELASLPERLRNERRERDQTLPPLDDLNHHKRQSLFEQKASRGEIANRRRVQNYSAFLFVLLLCAALASLVWIYDLYQKQLG